MKTTSQRCNGAVIAARVARALVMESQWFEFEPWPDDWYVFTVKAENARLLSRTIDAAKSTSNLEG